MVMLIISISVYAVDTFTAINLLAFDRWAGQIKPQIPLNISRWIFAGCIILSFILLVYRWWRAVRVMKQGGVAKSYLDPLAVRVQSIRWGKGRGWKRFLVFAELTKSRKGADYVALFSYYSFEAWLRIIFAEGPRQVVNALTLYSVLRLKLVPEGAHKPSDGHSPIVQFFVNVGILADSNHLQAVILFGMLWTLVIWVISLLSLLISVILYLVFLWHHIPSEDGGLSGYCRKKINRRMERVVRVKVDKALKKENALRAREEARAAREGTLSDVKKHPTLPDLGDDASLPPLSRQTTMTTLPEYSSYPVTSNNSSEALPTLPTLPNITPRPTLPSRTATQETSWSSYRSDAPLMGNAAEMAYVPDRAHTPGAEVNGGWYGRPMNRSVTNVSQPPPRSFSPALPRPGTAQSDRNGSGSYPMNVLPRPGTSMSNRHLTDQSSALPYPDDRTATPSTDPPAWSGPLFESPIDVGSGRRTPAAAVGPTFPRIFEDQGRMSPLPGPQFRSQTQTQGPPSRSFTPTGLPPARAMTPAGGPTLPRLQTSQSTGYIPYSAERSTPASALGPNGAGIRSFTEPTQAHAPFENQQRGLPSNPRAIPPQRQGSRGVDNILDHY